MKLAIPVDSNSMEGNVNTHFGRTPYFLVYDTETKESKFVNNKAAVSQGGAGVKAAQVVVDQKVDTLITPQCGENAAEVIRAANITIYKSKDSSISNNINMFNDGKLFLLNEIHPGYH